MKLVNLNYLLTTYEIVNEKHKHNMHLQTNVRKLCEKGKSKYCTFIYITVQT